MALVLKDRVKETTTTTGDGTITLGGAVTGFQTFTSVLSNGDTTYYCITDGTNFEVGEGTFTASGTTLSRDEVLESSNSGNKVDWGAGTKDVFITQPAEKAVYLDFSGNIDAANASNLTNLNASNLASGTVPNARLDQQLQDVAGLAVTNGNFIVGDGSNFVAESAGTARTSLGLGSSATADTGISNGNVAVFTSGAADNDFLRIDGTAIEGRSASEVLSDIGGQASLTFGISNTNAVKIDSGDVADDEYARFTANGLESRSTSEVLSDIGAQASLTFGISNTNAVKIDSSSIADDEYARFTANGLESRSTSEVLSDIGAITASSTDTLTNKTINASQLSGTVANARLDAQLQDVAGLAVTDGNFIVGDGSNFVAESGATARTSLGLGTAAVLDTGISNTNIAKFTSGVADNDFLRVDGTDIEGRSAAEVLSDIGAQASLTFGISNTNAVKIDSASVADDEYARFTANGLESRSTSEVLSDIGGQASLTFGISNTNAVKIDSASVADDEFARFTANGLESRSASEVRSDIGLGTAAVLDTGISNTNVPKFTSGVADDDFLRVNGTDIEGRSAAEVLSDIAALPLAGGTLTGALTTRVADDLVQTVHSDTDTTPTAALALMRGVNDTYGTDGYTDWKIENGYGSSGSSGGTLSIKSGVSGSTYYYIDLTTTIDLLQDVKFSKAIVENAYNCTGTALDPSNGTLQYKTLSGNTTFTESFVDGESITLMIDDGSSYTVTWPTMTWAAGSAPTLATSGYTTVVLWHQGGLYGALVS